MADKSTIEWTDASWNPVRGCSRVSEGCRNCYAEGIAARFSGEGLPYEGLAVRTANGPRWTGKIQLVPEMLDVPLKWKKPRRIFVNSMSDLFHTDVPFGYIDKVFAVMALAPRHTFQILTKRPERMEEYLNRQLDWAEHLSNEAYAIFGDEADVYVANSVHEIHGESDGVKRNVGWPMKNVWLGTSVENQAAADFRIPHLLQVPAAVRFLSCEPLLSPVNLTPWLGRDREDELGDYDGVDWVIVGGESGTGARPMNLEWARGLKDQCRAADVACFIKQLGKGVIVNSRDARRIDDREENRARLYQGASDGDVWHWNPRDKKGGDIEEFPTDLQVREMPKVMVAA